MRTAYLCFFALLLIGACSHEAEAPSTSATPQAPAPVDTDVRFEDVAANAGLTIETVCGNRKKDHLLESTCGGVAVADYDADGDLDLYFSNAQTIDDWKAGRRPRSNALYRNEGDGTFVDVAKRAGVDRRGWSSGVYFADYDNDGDKDLFVTAWGPNTLYRNDGNGTFTDVTGKAGVAGLDSEWSASAAFGDLDADGDLDLYVSNYVEYDLADPPLGAKKVLWKGVVMAFPGPMGFTGQPDRLYRNDGNGRFTDITSQAGIDGVPSQFGLGVTMSDLDADGDLDIYVANDSCPNFLWRNDGALEFTEIGAIAGVATNEDAQLQAGMGTDSADFDGDGSVDLFVTNFSHDWNTLYNNTGGLFFNDSTWRAQLKDSYLPLAWGTKFLDFDNDGWLDLFVANGHIYPEVDEHSHLDSAYGEPNHLFKNLGDGTFANVSDSVGPGLTVGQSTRGTAVADIDRDGDLDLVLTNIDSTPNLLINQGGEKKPWLGVHLTGSESNRDAIGTKLWLHAAGRIQYREVNPFGSYQSQSDYAVHFGLPTEQVDRLVVRWPSGSEQEFTDIPTRTYVSIVENEPALEIVDAR